MTFHTTPTGHIELLDQWGHGKAARGDWSSRPATIVVADHDGHYTAWAYTGRLLDAATTAARFDLPDDGYVAIRCGTRITIERQPDDFWIEQPDGSFEPNQAEYPEVLAY